ncbi:hypothetical protein H4S06_006566, partial [Coemansia sp. BCRC 34490]
VRIRCEHLGYNKTKERQQQQQQQQQPQQVADDSVCVKTKGSGECLKSGSGPES